MIDETQFLCTCPTGFTGPTCDRSIMGKLTLLIYRCLKRRVGGGAHGGYSHRVRSQVVGPGNRRCLLTFMWFKSWFLKSDLFTWLSNSIWSFYPTWSSLCKVEIVSICYFWSYYWKFFHIYTLQGQLCYNGSNSGILTYSSVYLKFCCFSSNCFDLKAWVIFPWRHL